MGDITVRSVVMGRGPDLNGNLYTDAALADMNASLVGKPVNIGYDGPLVGSVVGSDIKDGLVEATVSLDRSKIPEDMLQNLAGDYYLGYRVVVSKIECDKCHKTYADVLGICECVRDKKSSGAIEIVHDAKPECLAILNKSNKSLPEMGIKSVEG